MTGLTELGGHGEWPYAVPDRNYCPAMRPIPAQLDAGSIRPEGREPRHAASASCSVSLRSEVSRLQVGVGTKP